MTSFSQDCISHNLATDAIFNVRQHKIYLDIHLSGFYNLDVRVLNQKISRHHSLFGLDHSFRLTREEFEIIKRAEIYKKLKKTGRGMHTKYLPQAFTATGLKLLSTLIRNSEEVTNVLLSSLGTAAQIPLPVQSGKRSSIHELTSAIQKLSDKIDRIDRNTSALEDRYWGLVQKTQKSHLIFSKTRQHVPPRALTALNVIKKHSLEKVSLIKRLVSLHYEIEIKDIESVSRRREFVVARHVAVYLCRSLTNLDFQTLGKMFQRDHSSIIHAETKIRGLLHTDTILHQEIQLLTKQFRDATESSDKAVTNPST